MSATKKHARIHRMVMPGHVCPYGLKALHLLESRGFDVEDHHLESKQETEAFKAEHQVETTPQIWIEGERVGGHDALRVELGLDDAEESGTTYRPVAVLFAVAAALAVALQWRAGSLDLVTLQAFAAVAMVLLALQKLTDVRSFSTMFLNYDLLARRWVPYAWIYPYAEGAAGALMLARVLPWLAGPVALFIGAVGAWSVFKAVYIEKRELKCACVGGDSNVPLGFISLTENLVMIAMGIWTIVRALA